jgi:hypothetical protein
MGKLEDLLENRFEDKTKKVFQKETKTKALAHQSATGQLSHFFGIFGDYQLSSSESKALEDLLLQYSDDSSSFQEDLMKLSSLTREVKAIDRQAILLHGERIKEAQTILKNYKEGAFSSWLLATYGNRQTPYNFLLYFDLYSALSPDLKQKADVLPRQAMYTLAGRQVPFQEKETLLKNLTCSTKEELLEAIRDAFPLDPSDKRNQEKLSPLLSSLNKLESKIKKSFAFLKKEDKIVLKNKLEDILNLF